MIRFFFLIIIFLLIPTNTFAVSSDFNIKVLAGDDGVPPTTPTLLSVVPTAYSQIDIAWSASSDNFTLGGYVLLRDGSPIATTSLTSFNDTSLTAETLYSYEVYAFDTFFNISTTSNSLSTTTPAIPATPPIATTTATDNINNSESTRILSLRNFSILTTNHEARFVWETYGSNRYTLRWGKNNEYNGGYISNDVYRSLHETVITDLESDTQYFYELVSHTSSGISRVLKTGQFTTKPDVNNFPTPNVLRLSALVEQDDVILSWQLPSALSIKSVRVVSSPYGYPTDINDGAVVYDGSGTKALDKNALREDNFKYYSVFVIDEKGSVSSGAVVFVSKKNPAGTGQVLPNDGNQKPTTTPASDYEEDSVGEISLHDFNPEYIKIFQNDLVFSFASERIRLIYQEPFTISIPYETLPRHLKSIIVTLLDPTDNRRSHSFLLRINKEGSAYESTIAPLNVLGSSRLQIKIFDFDSQVIGLYRKQIDFTVKTLGMNNGDKEVVFPDKIIASVKDSIPLLMTFIGLLLLMILFAWWRKRVEDN